MHGGRGDKLGSERAEEEAAQKGARMWQGWGAREECLECGALVSGAQMGSSDLLSPEGGGLRRGKIAFFSESALPAVRQVATPHTLLPTCRWRGVAPPLGPCLGPDSFCNLGEITCPLDPVSSPVSWGGVAAEWHLLKQEGFKLDMRN